MNSKKCIKAKDCGRTATALLMILIMTVSLAACSKGKASDAVKPEIDKDKIESVAPGTDSNGNNIQSSEQENDAKSDAASKADETGVSSEEKEKKNELKPTKTPAQSDEAAFTPDAKNPENVEVRVNYEYEYKWDDELNKTLGHYSYQTVDLSFSHADKLPELNSVLENVTGVADDVVDSTLEKIGESAKADEVYDDEYYENVMYTPTRADTNLVSLNYSYETYMGGAHGMYGTFTYSFDPASGNLYKVLDLIKDKDAFVSYVYDYLIANYADDLLLEDKDTLKSTLEQMLDEDRLPVEFGYDHASVIINPYELFAYAMGQVFVNIPYKNNEGMFKDEVVTAAENYMYPIDNWFEVREDFGDDGSVDSLSIYKNYIDDNFDFDSLSVYLNNEKQENDLTLGDLQDSYGMDPYFVHIDGRDFLYINFWYASEDCWTYVYEIIMDEADNDNLYGGAKGKVILTDIEPGSYFSEAESYDPKYAEMTFRYDIIGSNFISARYELSADKEPVMLSDEYYFESGSLTAKKDLTLTVADPGGDLKAGDTVTVKPGTEMSLFSTDGASYIDFLVEELDWAILRMPITRDENHSFFMEDGSVFDDWFDQIPYFD